MSETAERFLQAEELANRLAQQLGALKDKIDAHAEATNSLNEARDSLASLTSEMKDISKGIPAVISSLAEIDTSAILQAIERGNTTSISATEDQGKGLSRLLKIGLIVGIINILGLIWLTILLLTR